MVWAVKRASGRPNSPQKGRSQTMNRMLYSYVVLDKYAINGTLSLMAKASAELRREGLDDIANQLANKIAVLDSICSRLQRAEQASFVAKYIDHCIDNKKLQAAVLSAIADNLFDNSN